MRHPERKRETYVLIQRDQRTLLTTHVSFLVGGLCFIVPRRPGDLVPCLVTVTVAMLGASVVAVEIRFGGEADEGVVVRHAPVHHPQRNARQRQQSRIRCRNSVPATSRHEEGPRDKPLSEVLLVQATLTGTRYLAFFFVPFHLWPRFVFAAVIFFHLVFAFVFFLIILHFVLFALAAVIVHQLAGERQR